MKYLEELDNGDIFTINNSKFILTSDFKHKNKNIQKMCVDMISGCIQWMDADTIVDDIDLYYRDIDGNILPIKTPKDHAKNSHIS